MILTADPALMTRAVFRSNGIDIKAAVVIRLYFVDLAEPEYDQEKSGSVIRLCFADLEMFE